MKDYTIYVTEDIAKKAIEKGFEGHSVSIAEPLPNVFESKDHYHYFIPTAEQICNWLRKEKYLWVYSDYVYVSEDNEERWLSKVINLDTKKIVAHGDNSQMEYNDALLEGINKALGVI